MSYGVKKSICLHVNLPPISAPKFFILTSPNQIQTKNNLLNLKNLGLLEPLLPRLGTHSQSGLEGDRRRSDRHLRFRH
jgi:hypothetical protein